MISTLTSRILIVQTIISSDLLFLFQLLSTTFDLFIMTIESTFKTLKLGSNEPKSCSCCCKEFEFHCSASNYWDLESCSHRLCGACFTKFSLSKSIKKICPACKEPATSIIHTTFKHHGRGTNKKLCKIENEISLFHPDDEADYLTLQTRNCLPITVCLEPPSECCSPEHLAEIEGNMQIIFRKMKQILVPKSNFDSSSNNSIIPHSSHQRDTFQGKTFFDKMDRIVHDASSSLLLKCLSSLALGNDCVLSFLDQDRKKKFLTQMFVAAENIRCAIDTKGSRFRQLMTDAFSIMGKTSQCSMLSKLGISYSRSTRDKYWKKGVMIYW